MTKDEFKKAMAAYFADMGIYPAYTVLVREECAL